MYWEQLHLFSPGFTSAISVQSGPSHVLLVTDVLLSVWQSNMSSSCSHLKAVMLMLWLLAVLSQRAVSLQLRLLAGSPGCCVAGLPHPPAHSSAECTARLCHSSRFTHCGGSASDKLQHSIDAPVWMNPAPALHALPLSYCDSLRCCQQGFSHFTLNSPQSKWENLQLISL